MNNNNNSIPFKVISFGDVHLRFQSRHTEFKIVFDRFIKDIKKEKPKFVVFTGDLYHIKINLSPTALDLASYLLKSISEEDNEGKGCDIFLVSGNHDTNLQSVEQGNAIEATMKYMPNAFVITKENNTITRPKNGGNGIYFFKDSGFYNYMIPEGIIPNSTNEIREISFGVFSCLDGQILSLKKEDKLTNKKYIALYHGAVYGSRSENGHVMKSDELIKKSVFDNFDIVMMSDVHQYNVFENGGVENMAYTSSLIQQGYGEEIEAAHGYLLWDLNTNTHKRKFILNDYGFFKLSIASGEDIDERLEGLKFSLDKKRTKVWVEIEEYEENQSLERLNQIQKFIKDKHGCEYVVVVYKTKHNTKELSENTLIDDENINNSEDFHKLLIEFLEQNNFDNIDDVIELSKEIDGLINFTQYDTNGLKWELNSVEVSNLFSLPVETTMFDFDKLKGITGIFGPNYNGKSNFIRAIIWGLYQKILGDGDATKLTNLYTKVDVGWVRIVLTIGSQKFMIYRAIKVRTNKKGEKETAYKVQYKYLDYTYDDSGKVLSNQWKNIESEEAATEKNETKKLIINSIGTFEDFTKVCLQTQGGKDDYLSLSQQPKNDLINRFLGLDIFRERYDLANETFKKIKATQKAFGDPQEIEKLIQEETKKTEEEKIQLDLVSKEKNSVETKIEIINKDIINLTKQLIKIENTVEFDENNVNEKIKKEKDEILLNDKKIPVIEEWLSKNFKKEIEGVDDINSLNKEKIESDIKSKNSSLKKEEEDFILLEKIVSSSFKKEIPIEISGEVNSLGEKEKLDKQITEERNEFIKEKELYTKTEQWIKNNPQKEELSIESTEKEIGDIKELLPELYNKLKIAKGEKCPTCGHVSHEPNPILEKEIKEKILKTEQSLAQKNAFVVNQKDVIKHNTLFDKENNRLESLKNSLQTRRLNGEQLKKRLDALNSLNEIIEHNKKYDNDKYKLEILRASIQRIKSELEKLNKNFELSIKLKDIIEHNNLVESKSKELKLLREQNENRRRNIDKLNEQLLLLIKNKNSLEENKLINHKIEGLNEDIKAYKITILQLDEKIKEYNGNIRVLNNNIESNNTKLRNIRESDRIYKKYSIYLQAVNRDGIPSKIIKKKLPLINYRINNILKGVVDFKIEMYIKPNGDIKEGFYFSDTKTDELPMSMSSGSQKFLGSIAIRDALHFVSKLTKPSLCMIDEGFGTLDNEKVSEISNIFPYLSNSYKNTLVITHRNEVKDFVNNIIQVIKKTNGISEDELKDNPHAGISYFDVK